jgi:cobalt-zinc-cadmium efflux system outer membrane protein
MYRKIILCVGLVWSISGAIQAQTANFSDYLQVVARQHPQLSAMQQQLSADQMANLLSLTPDDPEVGFNYLFPSPRVKPYRLDYQISQSFAFPTLYGRTQKWAKSQNEALHWQAKALQQQWLLQAAQSQLQWIFLHKKLQFLGERYQTANALYEAYQKATSAGETSALERNRARLFAMQLGKQRELLEIEKESLAQQLSWMGGGSKMPNDISLPLWELPDNFKDWMETGGSQVLLSQKYASMVQKDEAMLRLNQAKWLPNLNIGFMQEQDLEVVFRGATFGLSIPLWQQKNQVKYAKSQLKATQESIEVDKQVQWQESYVSWQKAQQLQNYVAEIEEILAQNPHPDLLRKALDEGEMTLFEYLNEKNLVYELEDQWLQAQEEYFQQLLMLYRWKLLD